MVSTEFLVPTLRYNRLDATGAAGIPGSYVFLRRSGDAASAIGDFGFSAADATELRVHPTDASGASRAAFLRHSAGWRRLRLPRQRCRLRAPLHGDECRDDRDPQDVSESGTSTAMAAAATTSSTPPMFPGMATSCGASGPASRARAASTRRSTGEPVLLYGEPVREGTYRVEEGLPCIVDVPAGGAIVYGGSYNLKPDADDPDAPPGGVLLLDVEMDSTLQIDTPTCPGDRPRHGVVRD